MPPHMPISGGAGLWRFRCGHICDLVATGIEQDVNGRHEGAGRAALLTRTHGSPKRLYRGGRFHVAGSLAGAVWLGARCCSFSRRYWDLPCRPLPPSFLMVDGLAKAGSSATTPTCVKLLAVALVRLALGRLAGDLRCLLRLATPLLAHPCCGAL